MKRITLSGAGQEKNGSNIGFLKVKEVVEVLGLTRRRIYGLMANGDLEHKKIKSEVYIKKTSIIKYFIKNLGFSDLVFKGKFISMRSLKDIIAEMNSNYGENGFISGLSDLFPYFCKSEIFFHHFNVQAMKIEFGWLFTITQKTREEIIEINEPPEMWWHCSPDLLK